MKTLGLIVIGAMVLLGCSSGPGGGADASPRPDASVPDATGRLCTAGSCPSGYLCGTGREDRAQCVVRCSQVGPGAAAGCPEGTFCYVPPNTGEPGFCTLICSDDAACRARHPSLVCRERAQAEPWALRLCVL